MGATARIDVVTRRWWFLVLVTIAFFVPSISARPVDPRDTSQLILEVMSHSFVSELPAVVYAVFKAIPVLLVLGLVWRPGLFGQALGLYAGANILALAFLQNAGNTPSHGLAAITGNMIVYALVGLLWLWEGLVVRGDYSLRRLPWWRYWVVPPALLAFWFPVNDAIRPAFSLATLFTNQAGLTLCMMLPVYLAVLSLYHPRVNLRVMRLTAFAGLVTGALNLVQWFGFMPQHWWMGVLHLPLVTISLYALAVSLRRR